MNASELINADDLVDAAVGAFEPDNASCKWYFSFSGQPEAYRIQTQDDRDSTNKKAAKNPWQPFLFCSISIHKSTARLLPTKVSSLSANYLALANFAFS